MIPQSLTSTQIFPESRLIHPAPRHTSTPGRATAISNRPGRVGWMRVPSLSVVRCVICPRLSLYIPGSLVSTELTLLVVWTLSLLHLELPLQCNRTPFLRTPFLCSPVPCSHHSILLPGPQTEHDGYPDVCLNTLCLSCLLLSPTYFSAVYLSATLVPSRLLTWSACVSAF